MLLTFLITLTALVLVASAGTGYLLFKYLIRAFRPLLDLSSQPTGG